MTLYTWNCARYIIEWAVPKDSTILKHKLYVMSQSTIAPLPHPKAIKGVFAPVKSEVRLHPNTFTWVATIQQLKGVQVEVKLDDLKLTISENGQSAKIDGLTPKIQISEISYSDTPNTILDSNLPMSLRLLLSATFIRKVHKV